MSHKLDYRYQVHVHHCTAFLCSLMSCRLWYDYDRGENCTWFYVLLYGIRVHNAKRVCQTTMPWIRRTRSSAQNILQAFKILDKWDVTKLRIHWRHSYYTIKMVPRTPRRFTKPWNASTTTPRTQEGFQSREVRENRFSLPRASTMWHQSAEVSVLCLHSALLSTRVVSYLTEPFATLRISGWPPIE